MENFRYIPLTIFLGLVIFAGGCSLNPFQSRSPAPVEDTTGAAEPRSRTHAEHAPEPESAPVPRTPPAPHAADAPAIPVENSGAVKSSPAVVALLDDADRNTVSGQRERAAASLERAVRIEPKNPLPWHKLGRLRLEEKNWKQALALAQKSNVLAAGNKVLQAENWKIIARASAALGDEAGAAKAREMVRQLEQK